MNRFVRWLANGVGWLAFLGIGCAHRETRWEGTWSAPSLSNPQAPIVIQLQPGGVATEQVGDYHGTGSWQPEDGAAWIRWTSGWVGLLRARPDGAVELLTWKPATPTTGPPDDLQPARRLAGP